MPEDPGIGRRYALAKVYREPCFAGGIGMTRKSIRFVGAAAMATVLGLGSAQLAVAQDQPQDSPPVPPVAEQPAHSADGRRHADVPVEAYAVVPGTKFLVRLDDELDTKETREKKRFKVTTLEPLEAGSGIYLPPGAEIRGPEHRAEPAG